jgi:hypothetical protein
MASTEVDMTDSDTPRTLSESLGTETLEAKSMVPAEYREHPEVESVWVDGRKFLKVDHSAIFVWARRDRRSGSTALNIAMNKIFRRSFGAVPTALRIGCSPSGKVRMQSFVIFKRSTNFGSKRGTINLHEKANR